MTTTDSEQRDDSLDFVDEPSELSPPPCSMNSSSPPSNKNGPNNQEMSSKPPITIITTTQRATVPLIQSTPRTTSITDKNSVNGIGAPPPTPLIGARQENRFTFPSGRIPALPDLRAADFFR